MSFNIKIKWLIKYNIYLKNRLNYADRSGGAMVLSTNRDMKNKNDILNSNVDK